jgi:predicted RecA/RadA family phage recombinase
MAQNYIESGDVKDFTLSGTVASGALVAIGDMVGVALSAGVSGQTIGVRLSGVFEVAKAAGAITIGAKLYLASGAVTTTDNSGANKFVGYAWTAAASGDATVQVKLG